MNSILRVFIMCWKNNLNIKILIVFNVFNMYYYYSCKYFIIRLIKKREILGLGLL